MAAEPADLPPRERRLDDVIVAYLEAVEAGQRPDPQDWLRRHPDLADELASFFAAKDGLGRDSPDRDTRHGEGTMPRHTRGKGWTGIGGAAVAACVLLG